VREHPAGTEHRSGDHRHAQGLTCPAPHSIGAQRLRHHQVASRWPPGSARRDDTTSVHFLAPPRLRDTRRLGCFHHVGDGRPAHLREADDRVDRPTCASVVSFPWANALVYRMVGETPPQTAAPRPGANPSAAEPRRVQNDSPAIDLDGLNAAWARAEQHVDGWRTITLRLPMDNQAPFLFTIDRGGTAQQAKSFAGNPSSRYRLDGASAGFRASSTPAKCSAQEAS
jgi:hypothetical protein